MSEHLTFRPATAAESDTLADLVLGEAEQESTRVAMRLYGLRRLEAARSIFRASWRAGDNWRESTVALSGEQIVGVLQTGKSSVRVPKTDPGKWYVSCITVCFPRHTCI